jgi:hypothetical protein
MTQSVPAPQSNKLLDQYSDALRLKQYSTRTEKHIFYGSGRSFYFITNDTPKRWAFLKFANLLPTLFPKRKFTPPLKTRL